MFTPFEYVKIGIHCFIVFILALLMYFVVSLVSTAFLETSEKLSEYECGFEPFDMATRQPFDVHFYVVGILFLVFDVEIALLFPWVVSFKLINWFAFWNMMLFIIILTIGFVYEWASGALNWSNITKTPC